MPGIGKFVDFNHPNSIDWDRFYADVYDRLKELNSEGFLIVEGHLLLSGPAAPFKIDHSYFLDVPPDVRFIRRLKRDMAGGRMSTDPIFIADYYLACARPGHLKFIEPAKGRAGRILDGEVSAQELAALIEAEVNLSEA